MQSHLIGHCYEDYCLNFLTEQSWAVLAVLMAERQGTRQPALHAAKLAQGARNSLDCDSEVGSTPPPNLRPHLNVLDHGPDLA